MYVCGIFIRIDLFMVLDFFFFFSFPLSTVSLIKLHLAKRVGCVDGTWAENKCEPSAVWHLAGAWLSHFQESPEDGF